ncbi:MAG: hypothetical protein ABIR33_17740 [Pyrinomonadaceae bacterium]
MEPRYRYTKASISSPLLRAERVEVKFVSDALALLYGLGEGGLHMNCGGKGYSNVVAEVFVPYRRLAGRDEADIWWVLDSEVDVEIAKRHDYSGNTRHLRAAKRSDLVTGNEWSEEMDRKIERLRGESWFRLRHFAALVIEDIRISETHFGVPTHVRAAKDANLTEPETEVAYHINSKGTLETLLRLTDLYH